MFVVVFTLLCIGACIGETIFSDKVSYIIFNIYEPFFIKLFNSKEHVKLRQGIEKDTNSNHKIAKHASEHKIARIHELKNDIAEKKGLKKTKTIGADCTAEYRPNCSEDDFCVNGICSADPCIDDSTCASHATFKMCSNGDCVDPEGIPYQENSAEDLDVESIDRSMMDESSLTSSSTQGKI